MINPKIFREYDVRGIYPAELDEKAAWSIGYAFGVWQKGGKIIVARDKRETSEKITDDFIQGLLAAGCKAEFLGVASTPLLFFAAGKSKAAGAMVTASHNPGAYTGIKFCSGKGEYVGWSSGLAEILKLTQEAEKKIKVRPLVKKIKNLDQQKYLAEYLKFIGSFVNLKNISGFNLALDTSDGAGSELASFVYDKLSVETLKINFAPNDGYASHDLNPMLEESRKILKKEVKKNKFDLGLIWDGDADRCLMLDEKGDFVDPYYLNCLVAQIILAKKKKINLVIDARLPVGPSEIIKSHGGKAVISRSGTSNICNLMLKKKIVFGCENSGHYFFNFNWKTAGSNFVYGDAIIPSLLVLEYLAKNKLSMSQALADLRSKYLLSGEINLVIKNFDAVKAKLQKKYSKFKMEEIDGLSVFGDDWFFNVRPSNTEPLVRLNVEARDKKTLKSLQEELLGVVK